MFLSDKNNHHILILDSSSYIADLLVYVIFFRHLPYSFFDFHYVYKKTIIYWITYQIVSIT